ncbi:unnamed protein product, partial [Polarella glacialis]
MGRDCGSGDERDDGEFRTSMGVRVGRRPRRGAVDRTLLNPVGAGLDASKHPMGWAGSAGSQSRPSASAPTPNVASGWQEEEGGLGDAYRDFLAAAAAVPETLPQPIALGRESRVVVNIPPGCSMAKDLLVLCTGKAATPDVTGRQGQKRGAAAARVSSGRPEDFGATADAVEEPVLETYDESPGVVTSDVPDGRGRWEVEVTRKGIIHVLRVPAFGLLWQGAPVLVADAPGSEKEEGGLLAADRPERGSGNWPVELHKILSLLPANVRELRLPGFEDEELFPPLGSGAEGPELQRGMAVELCKLRAGASYNGLSGVVLSAGPSDRGRWEVAVKVPVAVPREQLTLVGLKRPKVGRKAAPSATATATTPTTAATAATATTTSATGTAATTATSSGSTPAPAAGQPASDGSKKDGFQLGDEVEIFGLLSAPQHNGRIGTVLGSSASSAASGPLRRWRVSCEVEPGKPSLLLELKAANIRRTQPSCNSNNNNSSISNNNNKNNNNKDNNSNKHEEDGFQLGDEVEILGLLSAPQHNGRIGTVLGSSASSASSGPLRRWRVRVAAADSEEEEAVFCPAPAADPVAAPAEDEAFSAAPYACAPAAAPQMPPMFHSTLDRAPQAAGAQLGRRGLRRGRAAESSIAPSKTKRLRGGAQLQTCFGEGPESEEEDENDDEEESHDADMSGIQRQYPSSCLFSDTVRMAKLLCDKAMTGRIILTRAARTRLSADVEDELQHSGLKMVTGQPSSLVDEHFVVARTDEVNVKAIEEPFASAPSPKAASGPASLQPRSLDDASMQREMVQLSQHQQQHQTALEEERACLQAMLSATQEELRRVSLAFGQAQRQLQVTEEQAHHAKQEARSLYTQLHAVSSGAAAERSQANGGHLSPPVDRHAGAPPLPE